MRTDERQVDVDELDVLSGSGVGHIDVLAVSAVLNDTVDLVLRVLDVHIQDVAVVPVLALEESLQAPHKLAENGETFLTQCRT